MGRQLSASKRRWLGEQLEQWQSEGILTADQSRQIMDRYESVQEAAEVTNTRAVNALMGTAALLVVAGVFLLISFNWEYMPTAAKLLLIFSTILGTYYCAFQLRQRDMVGLSNVFFFLGASFYGCGIMLIGQIFHLSGHTPDAVWWWALGTLPIVICLESLLLHALLVALLAIWCGYEILGYGDLGLGFFFRWRWVPNSAYTLPLLAAPGVVFAYRRKLASVLWLYVPLLAWWLSLQSFSWQGVWHWNHNPLFFIGGVGGLLLIAAEAHLPRSPLAIPWRMYGVLMVGAMLIPLSFKFVHEVHWWNPDEPRIGAMLQSVAIMAMTIVALAVMARTQGRWTTGGDLVQSLKETARREYVPVGVTFLMAFLSLWYSLAREPITPTILTNIAMLIFGIWLMMVGVREDRGRPFSAGVLYFLLWTTLRYFDLFGDIGGMLGGAMFFFACGAFLFGMAWFWKHRNRKPEVLA
jgi:uncharacterized membrane protein